MHYIPILQMGKLRHNSRINNFAHELTTREGGGQVQIQALNHYVLLST